MGELQNGQKVRINETCVPDYVGVTGTITDVDINTTDQPFVYRVEFDKPLSGGLKGEYFARDELDILTND